MQIEFTHLSKPLKIGGKVIKNRIVVPAMADFGMTEKDSLINERHIERYGKYAAGGAGLIIIEACAVTKMPEPRNTVGLYSDDCLSGLKLLAEATRNNGATALVQLMETGLQTMPEKSIEEIKTDDFLRYKQDFILSAIRCQKAGFDGVELHAAHGMYLNQIIETSTRSDKYGGSFENRVRIVVELIEEIKAVCGSDFLVAIRFGNANLQELVQTAIAIEQAGADLLDVSTGLCGYGNAPQDFPFDSKIYAASLVKKYARIPVIGVGNIVFGEQAEAVLKGKFADMVAVGRGIFVIRHGQIKCLLEKSQSYAGNVRIVCGMLTVESVQPSERKEKLEMEHKCKITVIRKECFSDLQEQYLANPKSGICPLFEVGQEFILERNDKRDDFWHMLDGKFCSEAWDAISRYVYAALQGGAIMKGWTNDEKMMIACCNDGTRPVIFKIERIDVEEKTDEA